MVKNVRTNRNLDAKARAASGQDGPLSATQTGIREQTAIFDPSNGAVGIVSMVIVHNPNVEFALKNLRRFASLSTTRPDLDGSIVVRKRTEGDAMVALAISTPTSTFTNMLKDSLEAFDINFTTDPEQADPSFQHQAKFTIPISELGEKMPAPEAVAAYALYENAKHIGLGPRETKAARLALKQVMGGAEFGAVIDKKNERMAVAVSLFAGAYPDKKEQVVEHAVGSLGLERGEVARNCNSVQRLIERKELAARLIPEMQECETGDQAQKPEFTQSPPSQTLQVSELSAPAPALLGKRQT